MCGDIIDDAGASCGSIASPISHNRVCMTPMAGLTTQTVPDRLTTLLSSLALRCILKVCFPGPLRGGSPSSTQPSVAIARRSGSNQ